MEDGGKQALVLTDRKVLSLMGVLHVASFDEGEIALETVLGFLSLKGEGLHITQLNLDEGSLTAEGYFHAVVYRENRPGRSGARGRSVLNRLFK
ncbi:MAG TPA: sporulation protein YabP [Spirochaetia bacterium]|nr:sporulation protein YabP [Spirochaetia bacterium]